jgi:hypothetical protein
MDPKLMLIPVKIFMPPTTALFSVLNPNRAVGVALRECRNKIYIMDLVARVDSLLPGPGAGKSLSETVQKAYELGSFPALWAIEGIGHKWGEAVVSEGRPPESLLKGEDAEDVPESSLTMLHAGLGMALAQDCLKGMDGKDASSRRKGLEKFLSECRRGSREGYAGAAIESLGLVTRFVKGAKWMRTLDADLAALDDAAAGYFWHGAGRALYFSPPNFIPGFRSPWRAVAMALSEAPREDARFNLIAGLAWAVTLVNMRHPEVVEEFLQRHHSEIPTAAFANGVAAATVMRFDISPQEPSLGRFRDYRPNPARLDPSTWSSCVSEPMHAAVKMYHPGLVRAGMLEAVFRYQRLADLI